MRVAINVLALLCAATAANAACFENLGRTGCTDQELFPTRDIRRLSCQNLYLVRNTIYDENGLCFKTDRALQYFDNSDCYVRNPAAVRLNNYERSNVSRIVQVEQQKGCR